MIPASDKALAYAVSIHLDGEDVRELDAVEVAKVLGVQPRHVTKAIERVIEAIVTCTVDELADSYRARDVVIDPPAVVVEAEPVPPPKPKRPPRKPPRTIQLPATPRTEDPDALMAGLGVLMTPREAADAAGVSIGSLRDASPESKRAMRRARAQTVRMLLERNLALAMGEPCIVRRIALGPDEDAQVEPGQGVPVKFAEWVDAPGDQMQSKAMSNALTLLQLQAEAGVLDDPAFVEMDADADPVEAMLNLPPVFPEMGGVDLMTLGEE